MYAQISSFLFLFLSLSLSFGQNTIEERLSHVDSMLGFPEQFDEAIGLAENIARDAREAQNWAAMFEAYYNIAYVWVIRRKLSQFLDYEEEIRPFLGENDPAALEIMILLGNGYRQNGELLSADAYYEKAIRRIEEDFPDELNGETHLSASINRAVILAQFGDFAEARENYRSALRIVNTNLSEGAGEGRDTYLNLQSYLHSNIGQSLLVEEDSSCIFHFQKSLEAKKAIKSSDFGGLERNYLNMAIAYLTFNEWEKAEQLIAQVLAEEGISLEKGRAYRFLAELHLKKGDISAAHEALDSAEVYYARFPERKDYMGRLWQMRGRAFRLEGKEIAQATEAYQKALDLFLWNYEHKSAEDLPKNPSLENGRFVFESLQELGKTWFLAWEKMGRGEKELTQAIRTYEAAIHLMDTLRMELKSRNAKFFWGENLHQVLEEAIDLCLQHLEAFGNKAYAAKAYEFSNAGKAFHLKEKLLSDFLYHLKGSEGKELLYQQALLEERLAGLNKERVLLELQDGVSQGSLDSIQEEIAGLRRQLLEKKELWQGQNPSYKQLFSSSLKTEAAEIQAQLGGDEMIWDYFWGKEKAFVFSVKKGNLAFSSLEIVPLEGILDDFFTYLRDPEWVRKNGFTPGGKRAFALAAKSLFSGLALSVEDLPHKLTIVPDGPLSYLPFSALLTRMPDNLDDFATYPFLLNECEISYAYGQFGETKQERHRHELPYLGFAPAYQHEQAVTSAIRGPLAALKYNQEEVVQAQELLGGEKFLGNEAGLNNFLQNASRAGILHLALHGFVNDSLPGQSGLAFEGDPLENTLIAFEIPNLSLRADLVVLSACETGLGKYQRGEGVLSLARSFREAGAREVLMTQWSIDDKATANLVQEFFRQYKKGKSAAEALRAARQHYLNNYDRNHPYYWAGLVLVGEAPQNKGLPGWLIWAGLLLSGGLLLGGIVYHFIKRNET